MAKNDDIFRVPISAQERAIEKVDDKLDKLLAINTSQIEDIKDVKNSISEMKDEVASLSSQFKMHSFEDATRFSNWENKWTKEFEPVLKFTNERIALGGWVKSNQRLLVFIILSVLATMGVINGKQLMSFAGVNFSDEKADKQKIPEEKNENPSEFESDLQKSLSIPDQKKL